MEKDFGINPTTRKLEKVYGKNWYREFFKKRNWLIRTEVWLFEF